MPPPSDSPEPWWTPGSALMSGLPVQAVLQDGYLLPSDALDFGKEIPAVSFEPFF